MYLPRLVDTQLQQMLQAAGAVLLEGPKACGKTSTAREQAASEVRFDVEPRQRNLYMSNLSRTLDGDTPRLVDEWQVLPEIWNLVRHEVDDRQDKGQFILTGSATPADDATRHSGAMRIARLRMQPMSLFEARVATGAVSLAAVLAGERIWADPIDSGLDDVAEHLCRGGWPTNLDLDAAGAARLNRDYVRTVASADIISVDGIRRDPRRVESLIFALARNSASYVTKKTLQADTAGYGEALSVSPSSVDSYLDALIRLWVAVPQPAWGERLRSSAQVRRTPKWHLADPSLAAAILGATPKSLTSEPGAFGQLFESMVFRDLSAYAQANSAAVRAFQDAKGGEIDAVIIKDDIWAGFEVKLSADPQIVDHAARQLLRVANLMRRPPAALGIVTATGPSYTRDDGVHVISILSLGP